MKSLLKTTVLIAVGTLSFQAVGWYRQPADPLAQGWGLKLERRIAGLPENGRVDAKNTPWTDHVWSAKNGGITHRWMRAANENERDSFNYPTWKRAELLKLSPDARRELVKTLSPAEKFDLLRGRYDYPLVRAERERTYPIRSSFESLSLGWAVASTHIHEPDAVTRTSADGIEIPFASSDIKALTAHYYGARAKEKLDRKQIGGSCFGETDARCRAIDPASFHVILANMIGLYKRPFIADVDPTDFTDHRPVIAFDTDIRFESVGYYRVTTMVEYSRVRAPQWRPFEFYNLDTDRAIYEYTLEVNSNDEIVRGDWLSEKRPEFVWRSGFPALDHEFAILKDLYRAANILN